jgi:hypothetical protein
MSYHFGFDNIDVDWAKKEYVDNIKKIGSVVSLDVTAKAPLLL